jgi:membrane protein implicated in regulation of membrane protease activity
MDTAFLTDPANVALIVGLALLGLDILVVGLSPMMFVAVGAIATGVALQLTGVRPTLVETAAIVALVSLGVALLGKGPLQRFQNADIAEDQSSDLIGRELTAANEVTKSDGRVHWSGVEWRARLAADAPVETLAPGARARVTRVENLVLVLTPLG